MHKKLTLLMVAALTFFSSFSQTISPIENTEFCPLVDVTFTVTLPKITDNSIPNVFGWTNNPIVVVGVTNLVRGQTETTFTFVGRFRDENLNQVFRVTYATSADPNGIKDFQFKKIKSLLHNNPTSQDPNGVCQPIKPGLTSINVARCQTINVPISFPQIKWSTFGEGNDFCWGTITTYEYQLPLNWVLNGTTSSGSNWIVGTNSVTITSDVSNGDRGVIRVRPANNCSAGLANGQTSATINISRPAPALNISTTQNYICNTNGTTTATINGLPVSASVVWSLPAGNTQAQLVGCTTCQNVTVERIGTQNTSVLLTATVTDCSFTYSRNVLLTLGKGAESTNFLSLTTRCEYTSRWTTYFNGSCAEIPNAISYDWYTKDLSNTNNPYVFKESSNSVDFPLRPSNRDYEIRIVTTTPCGQLIQGETIFAPNCTGGGAQISVTPNPVTGTLTIQTITDELEGPGTSRDEILQVVINDKLGTPIMERKFINGAKQITLPVGTLKPDVYFVRVWNGKVWTSTQFVKQ